MWGRAVLCGGAPSQADSQLQEQLFKLYHNERDLENLTEELRAKQKEHERMVSGNRRESGVNVHVYTMYLYMYMRGTCTVHVLYITVEPSLW